MERIEVKSSYIESIGREANVLEVSFKSGKVFRYIGVPVETYESVLSAESIGRAVREQVVKGGFEAEEVGPETGEGDQDV